MADSMKHTPWLLLDLWGDERFCGGRIHLRTLDSGRQALVAQDGATTKTWIDGAYFLRAEANGTTGESQGIGGLLRGAGATLDNADGVFNLASFDSQKGELVLANDRLGLRPLYYMETEHWFAYAGEVKALLAIRDKLPDLDDIGLRQFFGFDHMLGERTWWRGIESIPPASVWRISSRGCTRQQYWTFDKIRRDPRDPIDVQVEFGRLWSQDVERHSRPGTMPLLLSGGQDSRLLLAELSTQEADLVAITFGSKESPEMEIARVCAATAGIHHRPCYLNTENWWRHREEAIWQTDGLINGFNLQAAIAMDEMHTGNWYSPVNLAGDLLFGGSHLDRNLMRDWRLSPGNLLGQRYLENPFFDREEVLSVSIVDSQHYLHGPSSDCFHLCQRMRRFTLHGPGCMTPYCEIVFPGVSHALLNLIFGSLSDEQRIDHKFYNRFLVTQYPKYFANIPWQQTGRGLAESFPTRLSRGFRTRLRRVMGKKAKRIASDQWFVNYPECIRKNRIREKLLQEDLIADQLLAGAARRVLADGESQPLSAQVLLALLTLETYLRRVAGMPRLRVVTP